MPWLRCRSSCLWHVAVWHTDACTGSYVFLHACIDVCLRGFCIYACMQVRYCIQVHSCMHAGIFVYVYMCRLCMHNFAYVCMRKLSMYACISTCMHTQMHVHTGRHSYGRKLIFSKGRLIKITEHSVKTCRTSSM